MLTVFCIAVRKSVHLIHVVVKRIFLLGSSAGAITVLQADYMLANRTGHALQMPADFRFAGVVSFSGTGSLVRSFGDCPHAVTRYEGLGHEVAGFSMKCLEETMSFSDRI